ncbi:MAG TPA: ATP-binding protein, partial [Flavisolibacter sp.]|nr:ATP-binding protein [Flavisolibacter sp.]
HGLDILDTRTGKVKKHYGAGPLPNQLKSNFIVSLLQSKNGIIYVGTSKSLYRYDARSDGFITPAEVPQDIFVSCLLEDHDGTIWVGTHNKGVYYFNLETNEKGHLENNPNSKNSLTTNTINALYEDRFHSIWFATEGGGICRLDKNKKDISRYTTNTGLPSNFVFKVLEDNNGNFWATTSKGLVKLNLSKGSTIVYTKENGLLNDQFNYNSGYKDARGKLYFGSVKGMIAFDPAQSHQSNFTPPIYITGFQIHNKEAEIDEEKNILKESILLTDNITLAHGESSFSIDFSAVSFTSPEMTNYKYRMEGLDKNWIHLKSNRKVYFTNLKPGTYTFKVKAINNDWETAEKQLTIQVLPPIWANRWAFGLYAILTISLLWYLVKSYHKMIDSKKEKEVYEAKIEFFTNIAHEIKTPLTLIKGPVENLSEMVDHLPQIKDDVATMERNTDRLVNLTSQILDFRQIETKGFSLDFSNVNITDTLKEAFETFAPVAKKRNLNYNIQVPTIPVLIMADTEALNKIFANLFSNAIKYADKTVDIRLQLANEDDNSVTVEIYNDGFIIPDDLKEKIFEPFYRLKENRKHKGTGIGLAIARSLVQLHNGQLYVRNDKTNMNVFTVILPFSHQHKSKLKKTRSKIPNTV